MRSEELAESAVAGWVWKPGLAVSFSHRGMRSPPCYPSPAVLTSLKQCGGMGLCHWPMRHTTVSFLYAWSRQGELNLSRKWYFQKFLEVEGMVAGGGGSDSLNAGEGTVPRRALCPHKEIVGVHTGSPL